MEIVIQENTFTLESPLETLQPEAAAENVSIGEIDLVDCEADERVRLTVPINGADIAFVYFEAWLWDAATERLYGPLWREHLRAPREQKTGGVLRPLWGESLEVTYEFLPRILLLTQGEAHAPAFPIPERYPDASGQTTWTITGQYVFADGKSRRAELSFTRAGQLRRVTTFKAGRIGEAPAETTIRPGDRFTPYARCLRLDAAGRWLAGEFPLAPLTLQSAALNWSLHPLPGDELRLGFLARDFDNRRVRRYIRWIAPL
jgi:hypothetical protein